MIPMKVWLEARLHQRLDMRPSIDKNPGIARPASQIHKKQNYTWPTYSGKYTACENMQGFSHIIFSLREYGLAFTKFSYTRKYGPVGGESHIDFRTQCVIMT